MKRIFTAIVLTLSLFVAYGCKEQGANDFIGLQMYSVRSNLNPLEEGLVKISEAGYSFVEMANYNSEAGLFYGLAPEDFKALCASYGRLHRMVAARHRASCRCRLHRHSGSRHGLRFAPDP